MPSASRPVSRLRTGHALRTHGLIHHQHSSAAAAAAAASMVVRTETIDNGETGVSSRAVRKHSNEKEECSCGNSGSRISEGIDEP